MEYLIPIGNSGSIIIIPWHIGLVGLVTCDGFVGRPISNLRKMMSYTYMSYSEPAAKPVVFYANKQSDHSAVRESSASYHPLKLPLLKASGGLVMQGRLSIQAGIQVNNSSC